tara:strand:+ start:99 stop:422 length:324 start_codon:yes stop_codon:yes gene_type:complete
MFTIRVNGRALKHIIKGTKNYEIRLKRGVFNNITYDMPIKLFNGEISTIKKISNIIEADTLDELFSIIDYSMATPYFSDKSEAIKHIHNFYSKNSIKTKKFIALNLV